MEFSIDRGEFLVGLGLAQGVVERRNTMPILANVLLEASGDLSISATDLEVHVRKSCKASVKAGGTATVGARKLFEFVRELPSGEITVRSLENQFVEIVSGRSRVKLVGLSAAEFPAFPDAGSSEERVVTLPAADLARSIDRVLFAVSTDDTRMNLCGVLAVAQQGQMRLVGTDGHRLALSEHRIDGLGELPASILPRKGLGELRKLLESSETDVSLSFRGAFVEARTAGVRLQMRLIDGEFPNYEQVVPKSTRHTITVDKAELLAALRRVAVVASDRARGVKLHLSTGQLVVSASSPDFGEANEELSVSFDGPESFAGFNAKYLTDVLGVLDDQEVVQIGLSDEQSPGVIRPASDESYLYIVMPMRL